MDAASLGNAPARAALAAWLRGHDLLAFAGALREVGRDDLSKLADLQHAELEGMLDAMHVVSSKERARFRRAVASLWDVDCPPHTPCFVSRTLEAASARTSLYS
mmetsp:Transcript_60682/g.169615  ORF Transcript_60682/g.169615 Transcript_60682/m.169615 type:complete len:104 (+) Transcript_60682:122-433(+)